MKRFTTYTQRKVLRYYWEHHLPFSIADLFQRKIIHFPIFGKLTLRQMESRGQIMEHHKRDGEILYIATTGSQNEWDKIWKPVLYLRLSSATGGFSRGGRNRYELEKLLNELEELIWKYKHQDDDVPQKCSRI